LASDTSEEKLGPSGLLKNNNKAKEINSVRAQIHHDLKHPVSPKISYQIALKAPLRLFNSDMGVSKRPIATN
jgi:hypothetical protein